MKLTNHFNTFLKEVVNLNQTRVDSLETSARAIENFLRQSAWEPSLIRFEAQGSWAHQTIIKPVDQGEFDADLVVFVDPVEGWEAGEYIRSLKRIFSDSDTYSDKVKMWDFCVTINYAGDKKVDIAPCVSSREAEGKHEVCDRRSNSFVQSDPTSYTDWLVGINAQLGRNNFRKVTRLIKYLRDIKCTFTCPSVLLTTLVAIQVRDEDSSEDAEFMDVPSSLRELFSRLDDYLQQNASKPYVCNPFVPGEDFASSLNDNQYSNLRTMIHKYRGWIDEAFTEIDHQKSVEAWQRVFGPEFGPTIIIEKAAASANEAVPVSFRSLLQSSAAHLDELVDLVKKVGTSVLPASFNRVPHMRQPMWPKATSGIFAVAVSATWHRSKDAPGNPVVSGEALAPIGGLWFTACLPSGRSLPDGLSVHWRITNTGARAMGVSAGRGHFELPQRRNDRWEQLQYRGVHLAEAFVVDTSSGKLVAQSPPFHVVIE